MRAKRIFENPNAILDPSTWEKYYKKDQQSYKPTPVNYDSYDDIVTFSYSPNGIVVGTGGKMHDSLRYKGLRLGRTKNSGRVFPKQKVITFWNYPKNFNEFIGVIRDLGISTDIDFSGEDWRVEIPWGINKNAIDLEKNNSWGSWKPMIIDQKYIPFNEYKGGYSRTKEELSTPHIKSPILKKQNFIPDNIGSKRKKWTTHLLPFENFNNTLK